MIPSVVLLVACWLLLTLLVALGAVVRGDGYGRRRPPQSHLAWAAGTSLEDLR
ncbi:hypothetical protein [Actinotalea sp. C106]|uniref:hypothetical protein n=1 Tax=Actinotalea sp. C106 TaxID=2908644 RepID=UPI002027D9A7|nr:hypothetical protein [Actinotalea sp. C106]